MRSTSACYLLTYLLTYLPDLVRDLRTTSLFGYYMHICPPWSVSRPHVLGAWLRSDGSFEYQFLIDNTVYQYFKFTSTMSIILQCRYFVSVLARDARYWKARFCNRMSSVHVCVRPSVTFVDQDHIGCKSWKLIAWAITPTPSLFVGQRPSTYFQGNMGKVWGDYRWVTGESGVQEHKSSNICDTRQEGGKVTAYRNSSMVFRTVPSPTPYTTFSSWRLCFETATENSNQSLLGIPQELVKVRTSTFVRRRSHGIYLNKSPLKMSGKLAVSVAMQGLPKLSEHPYGLWGASRGHFCDSTAFLLFQVSDVCVPCYAIAMGQKITFKQK